MTIAILWWILYIIGIVFGVYREGYGVVNSLFWWVLIGLLGYGVFGSPIK